MLKTEEFILNFGPQHPSTHGVFRMMVTLDGETIVDVDLVLGYLHRGVEKLAEGRTYLQSIPLTDRMDYICSMSNNLAYCLAVEKLADIQVPERAEYIRVIMAELTRVVNHFVCIGFYLNDLGCYFTPVLYCLREREKILDLFEAASGSRMTCNYVRFGGVAEDLPNGWLEQCRQVVAGLPAFIDEMDELLSTNEIFIARGRGIGVLPPDVAVNAGVTGPNLRASGVAYDVRKAHPYSIYDRFDFDVAVLDGCDCYDRYMVRMQEARQSVRILEQALKDVPEGSVQSKVSRAIRPPEGDAYHAIEGPKGEFGWYLVGDGSVSPYRWHARSATFVNLTIVPLISRGHKVADLMAILGSLDNVMGEVDR
ncbi:MAG: NADH-quinone oxidoreductase subunit D [Chloroflexi bacterium]|nr:NADH-quinone oxidoreductase subunit D [Chloroflexota bacterium]MBU1749248.1 NADH-quinone oxidoreductase subunit D [Chloroflexota bacterium]